MAEVEQAWVSNLMARSPRWKFSRASVTLSSHWMRPKFTNAGAVFFEEEDVPLVWEVAIDFGWCTMSIRWDRWDEVCDGR